MRARIWILCSPYRTFVNVFTLHCSSALRCMDSFLAIDSGGYVCTNSLRALIAVSLDACERSREGGH